MKRPVEIAFENFCADPLIKMALEVGTVAQNGVVRALAMNAFIGGAKYATARCEAEGHGHDKAVS